MGRIGGGTGGSNRGRETEDGGTGGGTGGLNRGEGDREMEGQVGGQVGRIGGRETGGWRDRWGTGGSNRGEGDEDGGTVGKDRGTCERDSGGRVGRRDRKIVKLSNIQYTKMQEDKVGFNISQ